MKEEIKAFLNNETYILAYRTNYDRAGKVNQMLIDYINDLQSQLKSKEEELKYTIPIVEHNKIVSEKNKQIKQLKEVIKEAREYMNSEEFFIKMNSNSIQPPPDKYCCQDYFEAKEKLLEILSKGENK